MKKMNDQELIDSGYYRDVGSDYDDDDKGVPYFAVGEWGKASGWFSSHAKLLVIGVLVAALVMSLNPVSVQLSPNILKPQQSLSGQERSVFTIKFAGESALAAGVADYTFNGNVAHDTAQMQAALNALPVSGGRLVILNSGNVTFNAAITRAIPNVTISGIGVSSNFSRDGINPVFTVGGSGWEFDNLVTDAGGITLLSDTVLQNVKIGSTLYALRSANGLVNSPIGRGATLTIASNMSSAKENAQADYICDGVADDVQIQAAINALAPYGGNIRFTSGNFTLSNGLDLASLTGNSGAGGQILLIGSGTGYQGTPFAPGMLTDSKVGTILQLPVGTANKTMVYNSTGLNGVLPSLVVAVGLRDLQLNGNSASNSSGIDWWNITFHPYGMLNVIVKDFTNGLTQSSSVGLGNTQLYMTDVALLGNTYGIGESARHTYIPNASFVLNTSIFSQHKGVYANNIVGSDIKLNITAGGLSGSDDGFYADNIQNSFIDINSQITAQVFHAALIEASNIRVTGYTSGSTNAALGGYLARINGSHMAGSELSLYTQGTISPVDNSYELLDLENQSFIGSKIHIFTYENNAHLTAVKLTNITSNNSQLDGALDNASTWISKVSFTEPIPTLPIVGLLGYVSPAESNLPLVGQYLTPMPSMGYPSTFAMSANQSIIIPFVLQTDMTFDRLAIHVSGAGGAGTVVRLGIYADNGSRYPSSLILDGGTVPADGATGVKTVTINKSLKAGLYWLIAVSDGSPTVRSALPASSPLGLTANSFATINGYYYKNNIGAGALAGTAAAGYAIGQADTLIISPRVSGIGN